MPFLRLTTNKNWIVNRFSILSHVLWYLKIDAFLFNKDFEFLIPENRTVLLLPALLNKGVQNSFDKKNDNQNVS